LARRATAIRQQREKGDGIVLVLDAGGSLFGTWVSLKSGGKVIVESMNLMGYDALTIGRMDLAMGLKTLQALEQIAKFPFLSANLVSLQSQEPIFEPYALLEREGVRIGIIGLSEPEVMQVGDVRDQARLLDPIEVAKRYVQELRSKVDVLVVLSHLGLDEDKALASAVPGIDVIVGGRTRRLMRKPEIVGGTVIVQQGYRGEWLGLLKIVMEKGAVVQATEEILTLGPSYGDDRQVAELVAKYKKLYPTPTRPPTPTPAKSALTPTATSQK